MKILHTSDIHLKKCDDERWQALLRLIEIAQKERVEVFVISGDLFDENYDGENLRPRIREIFPRDFTTIILPGNHDANSYKAGFYFGENVKIVESADTCVYEDQGTRIWGIPYENLNEGEVYLKLQSIGKNLTADKKNIILFHGHLIDKFPNNAYEDKEGYMPVRISCFDGLNVDYVLAGHFHRKYFLMELKNGGCFVYCGSPVSVTKNETGRRSVNIFETEGSLPWHGYPLDTFYYEKLDIVLKPAENPVETVRERLKDVPGNVKLLVSVQGYIDSSLFGITEQGLAGQINEMVLGRTDENAQLGFRDISVLLENQYFKRFEAKLKQKEGYSEEEKEKIRGIVIEAMTMRKGARA